MANKQLIGGLKWVKNEIGATLGPVRDLVAAGNDFDAESELASVLKALEQIQGVLLALSLTAPARLVEEMHQLAECLDETDPEHYADVTAVMGQALDQLGNHLDRLDAGFEEPPLSLWSIINALRSARDQLPLTHSELLNFAIAGRDSDAHWMSEELDILAEVIRQVRPQFHRHLVEWYRGDGQGLVQLGRLLCQLHDYLKDGLLADLFRLAEIFAESLRDGRLESSPRARTLMGHLDWALKPLTQRPPVWPEVDSKTLIEQLLDILTTAGIEDAALIDARMKYGPAPDVPAANDTQAILEADAALARLASDLVTEIAELKSTFDRLTLEERADQETIQGFSDSLRRLATRLEDVEVGNLPARLRALADRFQTLDAADLGSQAARLESYAMELLGIESVLLALAGQRDAGAEQLIAPDMDLSDLTAATLREAGYELLRVKEAIADWQSAPDSPAILEPIHGYLASVSGALRILGENPAADLAEAVGRLVQNTYVRHQRLPSGSEIDHLADAVAGLELYIGHLQQPMPLGDTLINRAGRSISVLQAEIGELGEPPAPAEISVTPEPEPEAIRAPEAFEILSEAEPSAPEAPADDLTSVDEDEDGETEFLDIFMEEAGEEIESARTQLARWQADPFDSEALGTLRRSFHTLKGSGRLVGALQVGDFAQAMEFLLNRLIETQSSPSAEIMDCIVEAVRVLPDLVEAEAEGRQFDIEPYVMRATQLRDVSGSEPPPAAQPPVETASPAAEDIVDHDSLFAADEELLDIFRTETLEHLAVLRAFLESDEPSDEHRVDEAIERALHTLTGSARMSGMDSIARVTKAMETCVKPLRASGEPLSEPLVELFRRATAAIAQRVDELPASGQGAATLVALLPELTLPVIQTPAPESDQEPTASSASEPQPSSVDFSPVELEPLDLEPLELEPEATEFADDLTPDSFAAVEETQPESFVELEETEFEAVALEEIAPEDTAEPEPVPIDESLQLDESLAEDALELAIPDSEEPAAPAEQATEDLELPSELDLVSEESPTPDVEEPAAPIEQATEDLELPSELDLVPETESRAAPEEPSIEPEDVLTRIIHKKGRISFNQLIKLVFRQERFGEAKRGRPCL
ncbi:Hpt domain-containing protein, partial [Allochromatium palmeri]|nr:hybrid sensor histidine kinase/response regulator [Allochromatium palmeri]